ncbi:MAG TPA: serine hydrolase domain-containing protein [Aquihabitans sp.]|jgi:CubicO group peptidase (beta-lactamase class C family)|nr:serine hydrolase domain-containing protein [Aquihabitans sp.]
MTVEIFGTVADGFEKVADVFAANFAEHGEVGAACAVRVGGEEVVDLWAGLADPASGRAYTGDTLQLVFSSTKGVVSAAAHVLVQEGRLDLDAPVAEYWPEFAQNGKADLPVRWVLSHQAGLVGIDRVLSVDELCAWEPFVEALAAQAPLWEPGTAHGYHAITFGHLVGELIRRITGQGVGAYVRDHVAGPVGAEFHIGTPDADLDRVAPLLDFVGGPLGDDPDPTISAILTPGSMTNRAFMIAPVYITHFNEPQLLQAEIPSANGCTSARSLARIYGGLVSEVDGVRLLEPAQVDVARAEQAAGHDLVMVAENRLASGYWLPADGSPKLGPGSFGHAGLGGSLGCALPEREIGFAYVMNQCQAHVTGDPRSEGLLEAVMACTA